MNTMRSRRIDEIIREKIASGEKMTVEDNAAIQQDVMDVQAREVLPDVVAIARAMLGELEGGEQRSGAAKQINLLNGWDATFTKESVAATVYMFWTVEFKKSLFKKLISEEDSELRTMIAGNICFEEF